MNCKINLSLPALCLGKTEKWKWIFEAYLHVCRLVYNFDIFIEIFFSLIFVNFSNLKNPMHHTRLVVTPRFGQRNRTNNIIIFIKMRRKQMRKWPPRIYFCLWYNPAISGPSDVIIASFNFGSMWTNQLIQLQRDRSWMNSINRRADKISS